MATLTVSRIVVIEHEVVVAGESARFGAVVRR
jgi:hypothetical protein